MGRFLSLPALALTVALAACTAEAPVAEHLVVDGWIEDGGYPVVILTSSVPVGDEPLALEDLQSHVLKWATVSVSDGENTVFLTGMKNDDYFPPYIYTSYAMKGQAGKKYSLKVRYGETEVSAETTVPAPQSLDTLLAVSTLDGYAIQARFQPQQDGYYFFFARRAAADSTYLPCMYTLIDGSAVSGQEVSVNMMRGFEILSSEEYGTGIFKSGEHVSVRFCTMDKFSYEFWKGYQEEWVFTHNPFFPALSNAPSNVTGGYGAWVGYGASFYEIDIP